MHITNLSRRIRNHRLFTSATACRALRASVLVATLFVSCASAQPPGGAANDPLASLHDGLRPTVLDADEPLPHWSIQQRMAHYHVPGVAVAVLKDGKVVQSAGFGVREVSTNDAVDDAVDADTLFSVGSISKLVTAATALRLVAQDRLKLDQDVNTYLHSWQIPPGDFADPTVTMRMLLSHTSGLNVHGFEDFQPGEPLPTMLDILNGTPPAKNDPLRLVFAPGTQWRYSGGGTMVAQRVIEDVTGQPLDVVAREQVFEPLGMARSTFVNPLPASAGNIAKAHDEDGALTALPRGWQTFPEAAASGLWTSANELGAFVGALIKSYRGKDALLPQAIAVQMMTEVAPSWHGLGPRLNGAGEWRIFHHGGANDSYRAWIEGYLESGDGFVILTNGHNGGPLMLEIRNALTDALDHGVTPPIRAIALPDSVSLTDYVGTYRADTAIPVALQRSLANYFESDVLEVTLTESGLVVTEPTDEFTLDLLPLAPTRFTAQSTWMPPRFEFHRDAEGHVQGMSVTRNGGTLYYHHQTRQAVAYERMARPAQTN